MSLTTVDQGLLGTYAQYTGFKNRLINGQMQIDQRNAGASVTPNNDVTLDRWGCGNSQTGKFTVQQSSVAPAGFSYSALITSTSAYSVGSGDYFSFYQRIEGYNVADLGFGTASPKAITISFWVRSSLTGTFGAAVQNATYDRSYPFSYTISAANTWEQKSVTLTADTTGTWNTTNGRGLAVNFSLGYGSSYSSSANSWQAGNFGSVTGATSVVGTSGATFYITGVQLEKGSTATSFDYRPYGTELQLCQRYFQRFGYGRTSIRLNGSGIWANGTAMYQNIPLSVEMRATPSASVPSLGAALREGISWYPVTSATLNGESSAQNAIFSLVTNSSGASSSDASMWGASGSAVDVQLSSEL